MSDATAVARCRATGWRRLAAGICAAVAICQPLPAKLFGADQRDTAAGSFQKAQQKSYRPVGVIQCALGGDHDGPKNFGIATLVGRTDTAITAAHIVIDPRTGAPIPGRCDFILLRGGRAVDVVPVRYLRSPWQEATNAGDPSLDYAVVKLARRIDPKLRIKPAAVARLSGDATRIDLIAFHRDLPDFRVARKSSGRALVLPVESRFVPNYAAEGVTVTRPERVRASDYASIEGTSGGAVYQGRRLVGIHTGSFFTARTATSTAFSTIDNFNHFVAIDDEIASLIETVAREH